MWNHHAGWFQPPRMPNELPALCGLIRNFSAAPRQQQWGKEKVALLDRSRLFGNFPLILFFSHFPLAKQQEKNDNGLLTCEYPSSTAFFPHQPTLCNNSNDTTAAARSTHFFVLGSCVVSKAPENLKIILRTKNGHIAPDAAIIPDERTSPFRQVVPLSFFLKIKILFFKKKKNKIGLKQKLKIRRSAGAQRNFSLLD